MKHQLPPLQQSPLLPVDHFPTRMQCFIFRNWEMIEPTVLGEILGCSEEIVLSLAEDMGLPVPPQVEPDWLTKGYITIIRANWHLCTYEQLAHLLGWDLDRLAYILREEDFLSVKLGNFKPDVPPIAYAPLTEAEKAATREIYPLVRAALTEMPHHPKKPFEFAPFFREVGQYPTLPTSGEDRFQNRLVYSYCALYGDTFADQALIDASFPEELLAAYQSLGITGVWTQAVLYMLVPFPFAPELSEGYEVRQAGMRYLVAKLAKYGLKLFLYMNEPRAMPLSFFEKYPELRGHTGEAGERDGYASLCTSTKEVQDYLYNGSRQLNEAVPGLGGYLTITASENQTHCYSHSVPASCTCPRCKERAPSDVVAEVNRLLYEGGASVNPGLALLAWTWAWDGKEPDMVHHVTEKMPKPIAVMGVSEEGVKKTIAGVETSVIDYSISVEGPGAYALDTWAYAHQTGHPAYAKLQLGVTWELSSVPCVPAFEKTWRHLTGIIEQSGDGVDGIMLGWTLGGFPSPTLRLAQGFYEKNKRLPALTELYEMLFPDEDISVLEHAFHLLSEAYDEYPFYISSAYTGPQQIGPANLLYPTPTGYTATMTGIPYDSLDTWRSIFPREVYISQLTKLSDGWHQGRVALEKAARTTQNPHLAALLRWTKVCDCHFRSMVNQCHFIQQRENGVIDASIAAEEAALAEEVLCLIAEDPTIGYESANHYFYHRNHLLEKLVNCYAIVRGSK